jgi:lysophospholipase L1-like esterase
MAFSIPDHSEVTYSQLAGLYQTDVDGLVGGASGTTGVISGCAVTAQGSPDMSVAVVAGYVQLSGTVVEVPTTASLSIGSNATGNTRLDLITVTNSGTTNAQGMPLATVAVTAGTAAATPVQPAYPVGAVVLAVVVVPSGTSSITSGHISDRSMPIARALSVFSERSTLPERPPDGYGEIFASLNGNLLYRDDYGAVFDLATDHDIFMSSETRWFRARLGNRKYLNTNVLVVADSMWEGYGAGTFDQTTKDITRDAIQRTFRVGGAGYIPVQNFAGVTGDATIGAPANAHLWTLSGAWTTTDFGFGLGRRSVFSSTNAHTATLVFYGTDFIVHFEGSSSTGTAAVSIDGTAAATVATNTLAGASALTRDVVGTYTGLPLGWHTVVVRPNADGQSIFLNGAEVFNNDLSTGVHFFDSSRSQWTAEHFNFNATDGSDGAWANGLWQPSGTQTMGTDGAMSINTNVFTSATASFTSRDVGTYIQLDPGYAANKFNNDLYGGMLRITAFTNSTTVTVDKTCTTALSSALWRIVRDDQSITLTSGSVTATGTGFSRKDVGKYLVGTGITSGTFIRDVNTAGTSLTLSLPATSSGAQTIRVVCREAYHAAPDALLIELGYNDMNAAVKPADFKMNMRRIAKGVQDRCGAGNPLSVIMLALWAPGHIMVGNTAGINNAFYVSTTNGSPTITLTTELGHFTSFDVGKTITGTGIPGATTISAVAGDGRSATMSANASATASEITATIANRQLVEQHWHPYRKAMHELAVEQTWGLIDLYEPGSAIGQYDPNRLTTDGMHPNPSGAQWIADRISFLLTGTGKHQSTPQGLADRAGEMIVAKGADFWSKSPGRLVTTANIVTAATALTYSDITPWQFYIGPNETLSYMFNVIFTAAANTTGAAFRLNASAGTSNPAHLVLSAQGPASASAVAPYGDVSGTAWTDYVVICAGSNTTLGSLFQVTGTVTAGAAGGLITPQIAPETAVNAAVTLLRGSWALVL